MEGDTLAVVRTVLHQYGYNPRAAKWIYTMVVGTKWDDLCVVRRINPVEYAGSGASVGSYSLTSTTTSQEIGDVLCPMVGRVEIHLGHAGPILCSPLLPRVPPGALLVVHRKLFQQSVVSMPSTFALFIRDLTHFIPLQTSWHPSGRGFVVGADEIVRFWNIDTNQWEFDWQLRDTSAEYQACPYLRPLSWLKHSNTDVFYSPDGIHVACQRGEELYTPIHVLNTFTGVTTVIQKVSGGLLGWIDQSTLLCSEYHLSDIFLIDHRTRVVRTIPLPPFVACDGRSITWRGRYILITNIQCVRHDTRYTMTVMGWQSPSTSCVKSRTVYIDKSDTVHGGHLHPTKKQILFTTRSLHKNAVVTLNVYLWDFEIDRCTNVWTSTPLPTTKSYLECMRITVQWHPNGREFMVTTADAAFLISLVENTTSVLISKDGYMSSTVATASLPPNCCIVNAHWNHAGTHLLLETTTIPILMT